jgi:hypothetical protein
LEEWYNDVDRVWTNSDLYCQSESGRGWAKASLFQAITAQMRRIFQKEKRGFLLTKPRDWNWAVSGLKRNIRAMVLRLQTLWESEEGPLDDSAENLRVTTVDGAVLDGFEQIQQIAKKIQNRLEIPKHVAGRPDMVCYEGKNIAIEDLGLHIRDIVKRMNWHHSEGKAYPVRPMRCVKEVSECLNCFCAWVQILGGETQSNIKALDLRDVLDWLLRMMECVKWRADEVDIMGRIMQILW